PPAGCSRRRTRRSPAATAAACRRVGCAARRRSARAPPGASSRCWLGRTAGWPGRTRTPLTTCGWTSSASYSPRRPAGGRRAPDDDHPDRLVLDEVLDGADLVVDATAEWGVHHALADLARERGLPYLCAFATPGYWGGLVARIRPGRTAGCWICLQRALEDGT